MSPKEGWQKPNQWAKQDLDHEAYIFRQGRVRQTEEDVFGKSILKQHLENLELQVKRLAWPGNDPLLLREAISSALTETKRSDYSVAQTATAAASGVQPTLAHQPIPEIEEYFGTVKAVENKEVIAEIRPVSEDDGWDVILPRDSFKGQVRIQQEFRCRIIREGSNLHINVKTVDRTQLRELKDFDLDEAEMLQWASRIDVCLKPRYKSSSSAED